MIDKTTGLLTINDEFVIDPTLQTGLFRPYPEGGTWQEEWPSRDWRTFARKPVWDRAGRKLALTVYFERERLDQVALFYYLPDEADSGTWDDWSREAEQRRQDLHDQILAEDLGPPPYDFPWGRVGSVYDDKGGFSLIFIRYTGA
jgi:hypothetical protein